MKSINTDSASKTNYFNHQPKRAVQFITFESPQQPLAGPYQDAVVRPHPGGTTISDRKSILKKPSFISKFLGENHPSDSHSNRRSRNEPSSASTGSLLPPHTEATVHPSCHKIFVSLPPSSEIIEARVNKNHLHKRMTCVQTIA